MNKTIKQKHVIYYLTNLRYAAGSGLGGVWIRLGQLNWD